MKELSRSNLFKMLESSLRDNSYIRFSEMLIELCNINITLLRNLEDFFLASDYYDVKDKSSDFYFEFMKLLNDNVRKLEKMKFGSLFVDVSNLTNSLYKEIDNWITKNTRLQYVFNKLVKLLTEYSDRNILKIPKNDMEYIREKVRNYSHLDIGWKQVFLSYAFDDFLYTIALFVYFYRNNIILYIDWMHNDLLSDGITLKQKLNSALASSEQLLFLRTINSELNISGSQYIRPWCSWETGNFFSRGTQNSNLEKYFINLYGKLPTDNMQLHGFYLLTDIDKGRLNGKSIW